MITTHGPDQSDGHASDSVSSRLSAPSAQQVPLHALQLLHASNDLLLRVGTSPDSDLTRAAALRLARHIADYLDIP